MISGWAAAQAGSLWDPGGLAWQLWRGGWLNQPHQTITWIRSGLIWPALPGL